MESQSRTGKSWSIILLNKPKGYVTTLSDPQGRPIVTSLIKKSQCPSLSCRQIGP